jgi:hypothetical protein
MVDSNLVIGTVLESDATHLLLSDGSDISSPKGLALPEVSSGAGVAVSYHVVGGRKVAEMLTIIPPPKRPGHPGMVPTGQQDLGYTADTPDTRVCPLCREPIVDTDTVVFSAGTQLTLHLRCDNLHRKVAGRNEAEEAGQSSKYGPMG